MSSVSYSQLFLPFICTNVGLPVHNLLSHRVHQSLTWPQAAALPTLVLQPPSCGESSLPGCTSPLLLRIWMNGSSLAPWLLDFHIVQFSDSSGCFLFLSVLLYFFWLYKEPQCVHLPLHLGQKSCHWYFIMHCVESISCFGYYGHFDDFNSSYP